MKDEVKFVEQVWKMFCFCAPSRRRKNRGEVFHRENLTPKRIL